MAICIKVESLVEREFGSAGDDVVTTGAILFLFLFGREGEDGEDGKEERAEVESYRQVEGKRVKRRGRRTE